MRRSPRLVRAAVACGLVAAGVVLVIFDQAIRRDEAARAASVSHLLTGRPAAVIPHSDIFYTLLGTPHTFGLTVTFECSAALLIAPVLGLAALLAFVGRVRIGTLVLTALVASVLLFVINLLRIATIAWAESSYGSASLTWSHAVLGSLVTVVSYAGAVALLAISMRRPKQAPAT